MGGIGSIQYTGSSNRGCARLGGAVAPPLGVVKEKVTVLVVLVRRHCCAVGAAVRRAVDDEVPGAVEEETAAGRRAQPRCAVCLQAFWVRCLYMPLVRLAPLLQYKTWARASSWAMMSQMRLTSRHLRERAHHEDQHLAPVVPL